VTPLSFAVKAVAGAALALFLLVGLAYTQVIAESGAREVPWQDVTGRFGPVPWPRQQMHAVRSRGQLERVLRKATGRAAPKVPPIDFRRRTAILAATGPRSSAGYDLYVVRVTERRDRVVVVLREWLLQPGSLAVAQLTYPYRLITISRTAKPLFFRLEGRP